MYHARAQRDKEKRILTGGGSDADDALVSAVGRYWRAVKSFLDDALPMPPGQRQERDWTPDAGEDQSRRRKLRLRLHMLEKRGKGGYR